MATKPPFQKVLEDLGVSAAAIEILKEEELSSEDDLAGFTYDQYVAMKIKAGSARKLADTYGPKPLATEKADGSPIQVTVSDPENQCPHCQGLLTGQMKAANRCGHCDKRLYEEVSCPYCSTKQAVYGARRCVKCSRKIGEDKTDLRRLAQLRMRGIQPPLMDTELSAIKEDAVRLEQLDDEIEKGGQPQGATFRQ
ncbi:hypothetical protein GW755_03075 [bacterium]|nr:hypothetical protein [bacterium]